MPFFRHDVSRFLFQFPNGSIKREVMGGVEERLQSFNSLMVRLKGVTVCAAFKKKLGFNSLMVRLKVLSG